MGQAFELGDRRHSRVVLAGLVLYPDHGAGEEQEEGLVTEDVWIDNVTTSPYESMTTTTFLLCCRLIIKQPTLWHMLVDTTLNRVCTAE
jgi:hypothetical protein